MNDPISEFLRARKGCLAAFCAINFCTGGLYVWSIFAAALAAKFSAETGSTVLPSDLSPVFGLATGITPFMMLAGGIVNDRLGPKRVIGLGGLLIALGYAFCALASSITSLYLFYGLLVGIGTGLVNGCTISTSVKYFPERRGFAGGLVTASLGIGAAVLPFAARSLIDFAGIEGTLLVFAAFSGLVIVPLSLLTRKAPAGLEARLAPAAGKNTPVRRSLNWKEMVRSATFWPLALLFMTSATLGLMVLSNISGIASAQAGLSAAAIAAAVSAISLANTAGRFVSGTASDAIGRVPALCVALLFALAGLFLLSGADADSSWRLFAGLCGIGICFGAFIGIYPGLVTDEFGPEHNSVNFSILMMGYSVGGLAGPWLMKAAGSTGDFSRLYLLSAADCALGLVCAAAYLFLKKRENR